MILSSSSILAVLATVNTVFGTPATSPINPRASYSDYKNLKKFNLKDEKQVCGAAFNTEEEALRIWYGVNADGVLDTWIKSQGEKDWFIKLQKSAFGTEDDMDCTTLTGAGGCDIKGDKCKTLVKKGMGAYYWIFKGVTTFHTAIVNLYTVYGQSSAISNGLRIQELVTDFDVTPPPKTKVPNIFSQIAAGMSFGVAASGILGLSLSPYFVLVSGILLETAQLNQPEGETEPDDPDLGKIIASYFERLEKTLQSILNNALGNGKQSDLPAKSLTEKDQDKQKISQFFADGKHLVANVGVNMQPAIDEGKKYLRQSLAFDALGQQGKYGWWVQVYGGTNSEKECNQYKNGYKDVNGKTTKGDSNVRWLSKRKECATLATTKMPFDEYTTIIPPGIMGGKQKKGKGGWPTNVHPKKTDLLVKKYGVKFEEVYENSLECAKAGGGEVDTSGLASSKSMPKCLFHMPVQKGSFDGTEGFYTWNNYNYTTGYHMDRCKKSCMFDGYP